MPHTVRVSPNFKKKTSETIQAIIVFIIIYLLLVLFAIALTGISGYAGIMLILFKPMWITLLLGAGLILMGLLVLIFLVKFIFHKSKTNLSGLLQIKRSDAPGLFSVIDEVAAEVGTKKPKKIYLSPEVNAYVFYDSSFWSMFLPIKKNLTIGVGLMNSMTVSEFKAILAHEFGHFSQRSMKVGSYAYNVNKVIYNMLYENDSYNLLKQQIAGWHSYVVFFANLATDIVGLIQKILKNLYKDINIGYMALSREMEFHADEVAASVAGSRPMISGLLRLGIADEAFQATINYYNGKIGDSIKTDNFFLRHRHTLGQLGVEGEHPVLNGLPLIQKEDLQRYNRSRLVITDQWASHPGILERVIALEASNLPSASDETNAAIDLIPSNLEEQITAIMFAPVVYEKEPQPDTMDEFIAGLNESRKGYDFPKLFDGFYNAKNPALINNEEIVPEKSSIETLYSREMRDKVYSVFSLSNDINLLTSIADGNTDIASFDYDGEKYKIADAKSVLEKLKAEQQDLIEQLNENDRKIYAHFTWLENKYGQYGKLKKLYENYERIDKEFDKKIALLPKLEEGLEFTQRTTPVDEIELRLDILKKNAEFDFRESIKSMVCDVVYAGVMTEEERLALEKYTGKEWIYFNDKKYNDDSLQILFSSIQFYRAILSRTYYIQKKNLLDYFVTLHHSSTTLKNRED